VISVRLVRCALAALAASAAACDSHILVGDDPAVSCPDDAGSDDALAPLVVPWQTGFENGFNDYGQPPNCYAQPLGSSFTIVSSPLPVRSGLHAAAFTVNSALSTPQSSAETRCVKQGVLPKSAYYGAWYYVPAPATNTGNWNLLHFRGSNVANGPTHGLWDVSLINEPDGALATSVFDFIRMRTLEAGPAIPIDQWFHLEVFFQRSCGATGEFKLYRDGQPVLDVVGPSDDTAWGGWHVGNFANALSPAVSTVYVDDVTISTTGP
jgi:hypothetical protein